MYVITEFRIDGLGSYERHPESTPIGPFATRDDAWNYASALQVRFGSGGGSVEVTALVSPDLLDDLP